MIEVTNIYKEISLDIIDKLEKEDLDKISELMDKRQEILESISDTKLFKSILVENGIIEIDEKIYKLLKENIFKIKVEIKEHKKSKQANNSYVNFNKEKLNIFNKKV
ncbi:MAG: flagellar protein FliT [Cetobacterium sp.]